ncbi:Uncharacterised protein [Halioglobus japonicus]|nr:Uncharacterised protein [Halioglobus japonicus]
MMVDLLIEADYWQEEPAILAAGLGFTDINGIPEFGADGQTLEEPEALTRSAGAGWHNVSSAVDPATIALRAYTSAVSLSTITNSFGYPSPFGDGLPMEFSNPVLASSVRREDIVVRLNNGEAITPMNIGLLPNAEYNERSTLVMNGNFGNRLDPSNPDAVYPVQFEIVDELMLVTPHGLFNAIGLGFGDGSEPLTAYARGKGPRLCAAKLTRSSAGLAGEGAPAGQSAGYTPNDLVALYGDAAQYRLRILTTGGFSPDGVRSMYPSEFARYFRVGVAPEDIAADDYSKLLWLTETDTRYELPGYGEIEVVGLAELGVAAPSYDDAYVEDHDNQIDIVLRGEEAAIARIAVVHIPAAAPYTPFYNPGGPGNQPDPETIYSQPGPEYYQPVTIALGNPMQISFNPEKY